MLAFSSYMLKYVKLYSMMMNSWERRLIWIHKFIWKDKQAIWWNKKYVFNLLVNI